MKIVYTGELDPRLCKSVLGETIPALAAEDPDVIYLDADLMNCIGTAKWAAANPDKGINCGIAEANMIGVACGLASVGFKPIVHTFGPFASRRCYDQAFLSGGYAKNDITIIGTDPGVTAALNGGTHMPFEDVALYRALPGATVIDVTDPTMLISVLRGSFIFMADLCRAIRLPCTLDFMAVSSYGKGTPSSGQVQITKDLSEDISGRHIIVVEDILDSGNTLSYLLKILENRHPASIRLCTLLDKPERRVKPVEVHYTGFSIPDAFVVGYGLDYAEKYRNLPYIGVLKPEVYGG